MNKKVLTVFAAGLVSLTSVGSLVANATDVDPWEAAANDYLTHANADPKPADKPANKPADKPANKPADKPADKPATGKTDIDEKYVRDNIDTPTGKDEKDKEDKYLDKAEEKYKGETAKQDGMKEDGKKPTQTNQQFKRLPKTSAVK